MRDKTLSVIGLGYIGLPTAAVLASRQCRVIGVDINRHAVDTINAGQVHIVEPDLDIVVRAVVKEGYLRAVTTPEPADAFLVAVPTPFMNDGNGNEHKPDLGYIRSASEAIAAVLQPGNLVVLESTSPVGATEQMAEWLASERPDLTFPQTHGEDSDIRIAHCPERVLPGHVLRELVENDRVIGGMTPKCAQAACELYNIFVEGECVVTNVRAAEMAKLTENSFRDVNIAFANELSMICDKIGIDVREQIRLANRHPRVNILQPGAGVGGHCIAVDPWFIVDSAPDEARLIHQARETNDEKPHWVTEKVLRQVDDIQQSTGRQRSEITVACLGLAFKPDIDDLRESPALQITSALAQQGCHLIAVEPNIDALPENLEQANVELLDGLAALRQADVVCILVRHRSFQKLQGELQKHPVVVDAVGLCNYLSEVAGQ